MKTHEMILVFECIDSTIQCYLNTYFVRNSLDLKASIEFIWKQSLLVMFVFSAIIGKDILDKSCDDK